MNQLQPIPKYFLKFVATKDSKPVEFKFTCTIPCVQQPPLIGDEVKLPKQETLQAGFNKTVFKVESRRFLFDSVKPDFIPVIYLHVS